MKALLIVDVQYDFLPGGSLAVENADSIISPINHYLTLPFDHIVATRDYHPPKHVSFASTHNKKVGMTQTLEDGTDQILWPDHCIQGSTGASISKELTLPSKTIIIDKGTHIDIDSYSGFFDNQRQSQTKLDSQLKSLGIDTLYIVGLCTEYCIKFTALDAASLGYKTHLVLDGCKGINPSDSSSAIEDMKNAGIEIHPTLSKNDLKGN